MSLWTWFKKNGLKKHAKANTNDSVLDLNVQYNDVNTAVKLCNRLERLYSNKERLTDDYNQLIRYISTIQEIEALPRQKLKEFETLLETYCDALQQKESVKDLLKDKTQAVALEQYEVTIPEVIQNLKDYEENQRLVRSDMNYLEGEKSELVYQRQRLIKTQKTIKGMTIALVCIFSLIAVVLTTLLSVFHKDILLIGVVFAAVIVFLGFWLYIFRRYVLHELKKNVRLQKRAVELMNKTKLKFVANEQYLSYIYKKYHVKNSEILEYQWEKYEENRKAKSKITKISSHILSLEDSIEDLVKIYQLGDPKFIIKHVRWLAYKKTRQEELRSQEEKKALLKKQIELHENDMKLISHLILEIKEKDTTSDQRVALAIQQNLADNQLQLQMNLDKT